MNSYPEWATRRYYLIRDLMSTAYASGASYDLSHMLTITDTLPPPTLPGYTLLAEGTYLELRDLKDVHLRMLEGQA